MLGWALIFFLLAILAGYLGFFGLAGLAATIAKVLLLVFFGASDRQRFFRRVARPPAHLNLASLMELL